MINQTRQRIQYILADYFSALIAWILFFLFRKIMIEKVAFNQLYEQVLKDNNFFYGTLLIPLGWIILYYFNGYYQYVLKKTTYREIIKTFKLVLIGVIILFFVLLLDDQVRNYYNYYLTASVLFVLQFTITLIPRLLITSHKNKKIATGKLQFKTLIIGCGKNAEHVYYELSQKKSIYGNLFIGFVKNSNNCNDKIKIKLPCLGSINQLLDIISNQQIDEIIIAIEPEEQKDILNIVNWLGYPNVSVKALANMRQVLKGYAKITNIMGIPLFEVEYELMPFWQQALKNIIDKIVSLLAIITLSPFFIFCAIAIKITSRGPIFFKQERIGKNGKPFILYKFRSMYADAEKNGPNLSKPNDERCTPFGRFLRRTKLDEIPNFFNVLKGDMSLVGPRPERQYYIDQIVKISPAYKQLQKIKPGITSLGQVRYGYASDVTQMIKRLRYDLLYMQNMSLYTDFLVIYYTIKILFKGRHY